MLQPVEHPPQPEEQPSATTPSAVKTDTSSAAPAAPQPKLPADPDDPFAPHHPGIYYIEAKGTGPSIIRLQTAPSSGPTMKVSTKPSMFSELSVGLVKSGLEAGGGSEAVAVGHPIAEAYYNFASILAVWVCLLLR